MSNCGRCGKTYRGHIIACRDGKVSSHVFQGYVSWQEMEQVTASFPVESPRATPAA